MERTNTACSMLGGLYASGRHSGTSASPCRYQDISVSRQHQSLDKEHERPGQTFLYLAYGSNLSDETFLGNRGIRPIAATNVQVPELRLTFDLPGIPYNEPCFANSGRRDTEKDSASPKAEDIESEKDRLLPLSASDHPKYRKDSWKKGMIGVVYEVTAKDYAHIIATEGGGASYHDILVDCYPFETSDPSTAVPWVPTTKAFKAHTLFAPASPDNGAPDDGGRFHRPDPSYAQASPRYLKLITDGAKERGLPLEYQHYLQSLQPYTPNTQKQRLGQFVFATLWLPFILLVFSLSRKFNDKNGIAPKWLRLITDAIFRGVWTSYDDYFRDIFGDGERTIDNPDDEEKGLRAVQHTEKESWDRKVPIS